MNFLLKNLGAFVIRPIMGGIETALELIRVRCHSHKKGWNLTKKKTKKKKKKKRQIMELVLVFNSIFIPDTKLIGAPTTSC